MLNFLMPYGLGYVNDHNLPTYRQASRGQSAIGNDIGTIAQIIEAHLDKIHRFISQEVCM